MQGHAADFIRPPAKFPPQIIRHAVWLYLRFTLSNRDVEELLAERALDVSFETIRGCVCKFGPEYARNSRRLRAQAADGWRLDESAPRRRERRSCAAEARKELIMRQIRVVELRRR